MRKILLGLGLAISLVACSKNVENDSLENVLFNDTNMNSVEEDKFNGDNFVESVEELNLNAKDDIDKKEETKQQTITESNEALKQEIVEENKELLEEKNIEEPIVEYIEGYDVGNKAIDFELELLTGEKIKLSNYFGKPIFLNFWATWCGPCVSELPHIEELSSEYKDEIAVLAINIGDSKKDVEQFINLRKYTFNIGLDDTGTLLNTYNSDYIPLSVFIDSDGVIKERKVGALSKKEMTDIVNEICKD